MNKITKLKYKEKKEKEIVSRYKRMGAIAKKTFLLFF